jgi:hypothetical protein
LVIAAVTKALGEVGVPGIASQVFPAEQVMEALPFAVPQLSQTAPQQYQEYDRVRSEAEFRLAIVPPIVFLAVIAPVNGRTWIIMGALLSCVVLLCQAFYQERRSNDILANAAYLGYITLPMVQAAIDYVSKVKPPVNDGEWIGAIIVGLTQRSYFDASDAALRELVEFKPDTVDAARAYLEAHAPAEARMLNVLTGGTWNE